MIAVHIVIDDCCTYRY